MKEIEITTFTRKKKMRITESYIYLENVRFYAYHGIAVQETLVGNEFIINLKIKADISKAIETDEIKETISYADVFNLLEEEMSIPSQLLEHVCGRITKRLFHVFPAIDEITIRLSKRCPPMGGDIETAGVHMICRRE